jgi:hypothetical protein
MAVATSSGISDQQPSMKGILVRNTSSGRSTAFYQGNPCRNHKFWRSTALYQRNPGRNHKFWHIGSTAFYQGNPGISDQQSSMNGILVRTTGRTCGSYLDALDKGLLIRYARTCGSYQDSLDRGLLIRQNLWFLPGFP